MTVAKEIPECLLSKYTMGGNVSVYPWWFDDSAMDVSKNHLPAKIQFFREKIRRREVLYYDTTDRWLYEALGRFPIAGKRVLIFGSENPWYEIMAQEFGVKDVTVVEYGDRVDANGIKYVKPAVLGNEQFDCALSISSFEHDGLGRYDDPLDPYGDLVAMVQAKRNVVYGGNLFLAVPVGKDALVWNAHRVYGSLRLPLLLQNWELQASFGFSEGDYGKQFEEVVKSSYHQPVFVLRNN